MRTYYDEADVGRVVEALAGQLAAAFPASEPLNVVGVLTRGETLAERLAQKLRERGFADIRRGVLDITLYRDDLSEVGPGPLVRPTEINFDVDGRPMLLVDDVLFTGRSIRSALDALVDFGRPSVIRLAVLADRAGRELPIQADFVGLTLREIPPSHRVSLHLREVDGKDEIVIEPR